MIRHRLYDYKNLCNVLILFELTTYYAEGTLFINSQTHKFRNSERCFSADEDGGVTETTICALRSLPVFIFPFVTLCLIILYYFEIPRQVR